MGPGMFNDLPGERELVRGCLVVAGGLVAAGAVLGGLVAYTVFGS